MVGLSTPKEITDAANHGFLPIPRELSIEHLLAHHWWAHYSDTIKTSVWSFNKKID